MLFTLWAAECCTLLFLRVGTAQRVPFAFPRISACACLRVCHRIFGALGPLQRVNRL